MIPRGDIAHTVKEINIKAYKTEFLDTPAEVTAEGSLLLALVIAPKVTAQKDLLICRKLASNGEKSALLRKLFKEQYHYYKLLNSFLNTLCC